MPKKGKSNNMSERERARLAVIPDLYTIYSGLLSESVIDMIAKQCDYDLDACMATLSDMVQSHPTVIASQPPAAATTTTAWGSGTSAKSATTAAAPSSNASSSSSSSSASSASSSAASAAPAAAADEAAKPKKKAILFLSPRPSSDLNKPQPVSVWKNANAKPAPQPKQWQALSSNGAASGSSAGSGIDNAKALIAAAAALEASEPEDIEAGYGSDANDQEDMVLLRRSTAAATASSSSSSSSSSAANAEAAAAAASIDAYTYTGYESQPYFDLQPRLLDALPPLVEIPGGRRDTVLDPEAPSAFAASAALVSSKKSSQRKEEPSEVDEASPAHPAHALHALYLQLNSAQEVVAAPARASWQQFAGSAPPASARPSASPAMPSAAEIEQMTPSQALAFQRKQYADELSSRKEFNAWSKQHEKEKRLVKARGMLADPTTIAADEAREREEREVAEALAAVAASEAASESALASSIEEELAHLSLTPSDIPTMPPLTKAQSRSSQEHLTASPQELVDFLFGLFGGQGGASGGGGDGGDIPLEVIRAVVESTLASPANLSAPSQKGGAAKKPAQNSKEEDAATEYRDLAQECCTTLLAILDENERNVEREREQQMNMDALLQAQEHAQEQKLQQQQQQQQPQQQQFQHGGGLMPRGGKASKKLAAAASASAASVPFVASGLQMTDSEIAARMSLDPDFDPSVLSNAPNTDPRMTLEAATRASAPRDEAPVVRNKKGHVKLDRTATHNAWQAHTPAASSVTPDLGAQWKLQALLSSFPFVDRDVVEQTFRANNFSFEEAKAHLAAIFPSQLINPAAKPQPVNQPWAAKSVHHSKTKTTSSTDAQRGVITNPNAAAQSSSSSLAAAAYAAAEDASGLSDELLEASLGGVLDNRGGAGQTPVSDSSLRALADVHARRRAAYFAAAASAFNRGAGSVASELAHKGRAERASLRATQSAAVLASFVSQNQHHDCTRSIDLHGLRVDEALRIVAFVLARKRRGAASSGGGGGGGGSKELSLITGVGYHSQGGVSKARLHPAVLEYLKQQGYSCSTATEGVIKVHWR